jgi:hypothetical protein
MKKLELLKSAITLAASVGVGAVVTNAVKSTTPADLKVLNRVAVVIGTTAVSYVASDHASTYFGNYVDELTEMVKNIKDGLNETPKSDD